MKYGINSTIMLFALLLHVKLMKNRPYTAYTPSGTNPLKREGPMKHIASLLFIVLSLLLVSNLQAGKIFIWKDKNGVKHFSDSPPHEKARDIKVHEFTEEKGDEKAPHTLDASKLSQYEGLERVNDLLTQESSKVHEAPIRGPVKGAGYDLRALEKLLGALRSVEENYHLI
jgi:hypothetical protein